MLINANLANSLSSSRYRRHTRPDGSDLADKTLPPQWRHLAVTGCIDSCRPLVAQVFTTLMGQRPPTFRDSHRKCALQCVVLTRLSLDHVYCPKFDLGQRYSTEFGAWGLFQ